MKNLHLTREDMLDLLAGASINAMTEDGIEYRTTCDVPPGVTTDRFATSAPEMILETRVEDGHPYRVLRCPHCETTSSDGHEVIYEVDRADRLNSGEVNVDRQTGDIDVWISQGDGDFHTVGFLCTTCEEPVSLPESVITTWD